MLREKITYYAGQIIGIQNDFSINIDTDNSPDLRECIDFPYKYISICLESLTVPYRNYASYTFEIEKVADLSGAGGGFQTQTTEPAIYIHTDVPDGLIIKKDGVNGTNITADKKTKKVWLSINNTNIIDIFYEDENDKVQYAGYITEIEDKNIIQINYLDTTSDNININSIKKETQDYLFTFSIKGDNPNELEQERLRINFNSCVI